MLHSQINAPSAPLPRSFFPLHRSEIEAQLQEGDERLVELVEPRGLSLPARRTVAPSAQDQRYVYRLRSGWCARLRFLPDGRAQVSAILLPGDIISVRSMFLAQQPEEIVTIIACELDIVDQAALRKAAGSQSALMLRLWWQTLEDERRLNNWLVAFARGSAEERIALMFLDIRGRLTLAGLVPGGTNEIPWPLTQQELGEALGLTAVHVNRTLKHLRDQGLVEISSRVARLNVDSLYALAHPLLDIYERKRPEFGAPPPTGRVN